MLGYAAAEVMNKITPADITELFKAIGKPFKLPASRAGKKLLDV
jgi:hypothetical protein